MLIVQAFAKLLFLAGFAIIMAAFIDNIPQWAQAVLIAIMSVIFIWTETKKKTRPAPTMKMSVKINDAPVRVLATALSELPCGGVAGTYEVSLKGRSILVVGVWPSTSDGSGPDAYEAVCDNGSWAIGKGLPSAILDDGDGITAKAIAHAINDELVKTQGEAAGMWIVDTDQIQSRKSAQSTTPKHLP